MRNALFTKFKTRRVLIAVLTLVAWAAATQFIGSHLRDTVAGRTQLGVQGIFRNDENLSDPTFLGRRLADLENLGMLKCVFVSSINHRGERMELFDSRFKSDCRINAFLLDGQRFSVPMRAISGEFYNVDYIADTGRVFYVGFFVLRLLGAILLFAFLAISWQQQDQAAAMIARETEIANTLREAAAQIAHDVASPLSVFSVMTKHPALGTDARATVQLAMERTNAILKDLKAISKATPQLEANAVQKFDLVQLLEGLGREKLAVTNVPIQFNSDCKKSYVTANRTDFERVFSNLINNAIEASESETGAVAIHVTANDRDCHVVIKDSGKGIPEEVLSRIGTRGFSFGKAKGSGLGVYHAQQTLARHGGILKFQSTVGVGTTAIVTLPTVDA